MDEFLVGLVLSFEENLFGVGATLLFCFGQEMKKYGSASLELEVFIVMSMSIHVTHFHCCLFSPRHHCCGT